MLRGSGLRKPEMLDAHQYALAQEHRLPLLAQAASIASPEDRTIL